MSDCNEDTNSNERKSKKFTKVFVIREAPLTQKFQTNEDIKTIYNLFAIIFISLLTNTIIYDYSKTGQFHFGFRLISVGFNKFHLVILTWCVLNVLALFSYCSFKVWSNIRVLLKSRTAVSWDRLWIVLLLFYYFYSLLGIQRLVHKVNFSAGSATIIFLEQIRLLMKQHAFIRTNLSKVISFNPRTERSLSLPNLKTFIYFLFVPTFVYRDDYPRTRVIRWKFVIYNFAEVLSIIWFLSLIVERFLIPPFEEICLKTFSLKEIAVTVIANCLPGIMFMLCGFYSVLHCFQNAFAEMLTFGDRMFYQEWWTCRSLSEYYKKWNVVVHDWLFTYIYKDVYEIFVPGNKTAAKFAVFLISALFHEWIIINVLKVFFPIQFIQFFIAGVVLTLLNMLDLPVGNLVVWYLLVIGSGIQVNLYTIEMFARKNCPLENVSTAVDFFKPRFITCGCVEI